MRKKSQVSVLVYCPGTRRTAVRRSGVSRSGGLRMRGRADKGSTHGTASQTNSKTFQSSSRPFPTTARWKLRALHNMNFPFKTLNEEVRGPGEKAADGQVCGRLNSCLGEPGGGWSSEDLTRKLCPARPAATQLVHNVCRLTGIYQERCQPITCALYLPVANHVRARFARSQWRARSACPVGASSLRNKHEAALESRSYEKVSRKIFR